MCVLCPGLWLDEQELQMPYYKHRNRHGDSMSIHDKYVQRVESQGEQADRSITAEDRYGQQDSEVQGRGMEGCQLSPRYGDFPPVDGGRRLWWWPSMDRRRLAAAGGLVGGWPSRAWWTRVWAQAERRMKKGLLTEH